LQKEIEADRNILSCKVVYSSNIGLTTIRMFCQTENRKGFVMKKFIVSAMLFAFVMAMASLAGAATVKGFGVTAVDGDTLHATIDKVKTKVKVNGIDAPEKGQPFYKEAYEALNELIKNKNLEIEVIEKKDGTTYAKITVDGKNVAEEMVKKGMAWYYKREAPKEVKLESMMENARKDGRGLWIPPTPPWEYRSK